MTALPVLEMFLLQLSLIHAFSEICAKGNLWLHKFALNDRKVIKAIPKSERDKDLVDIGLSLESLPVERALGMRWYIESDQFHFHIVVQDQPVTRRGILTVALVLDTFRWSRWRTQLPKHASIKIQRCYKPKYFGNAVDTPFFWCKYNRLQGMYIHEGNRWRGTDSLHSCYG